MKLLLDTHTFLWLDSSPEKLSQTALAACERSNQPTVSERCQRLGDPY